MTIRDLQADFSVSGALTSTSIIGAAATYLAPNTYDTSPLGAYFTELAAADTQLSANVNTGRDLGGGEPIWLCIDWIIAPAGGTSIDMQLITSASSQLGTPNVIIDTGVVAIASFSKGFRQAYRLPRSPLYLQYLGVQAITVGTFTAGAFDAFLAHDLDSATQGYASGFSVK